MDTVINDEPRCLKKIKSHHDDYTRMNEIENNKANSSSGNEFGPRNVLEQGNGCIILNSTDMQNTQSSSTMTEHSVKPATAVIFEKSSVLSKDNSAGFDTQEVVENYVDAHNSNGLYVDNVHRFVLNESLRKSDDEKDWTYPDLPEIKTESLRDQVFTHSSRFGTPRDGLQAQIIGDLANRECLHNERLEFLGDALFNSVVTRYLYYKFPLFREGELSTLRTRLISNEVAEEFSRLYKFPERLKSSNEKEYEVLIKSSKTCADIFEAYVAGIYLDSPSGLSILENWICSLVSKKAEKFSPDLRLKNQVDLNAKQSLHCLVAKLTLPQPKVTYSSKSIESDQKQQSFEVLCCLNGLEIGRGVGTSLKLAGANAAMDGYASMLKFLKNEVAKVNYTETELSDGEVDKHHVIFKSLKGAICFDWIKSRKVTDQQIKNCRIAILASLRCD